MTFDNRDWFERHFAFTDIRNGTFRACERFARSAQGLAGGRAVPFRVGLEDRAVEGPPSGEGLFPLAKTWTSRWFRSCPTRSSIRPSVIKGGVGVTGLAGGTVVDARGCVELTGNSDTGESGRAGSMAGETSRP